MKGKHGTPGGRRTAAIWKDRIWFRLEILSADHVHTATMRDRSEISARLPHLRIVFSLLPLSNLRPGRTHVRALPDIAKQLRLGFERERSPPTHNIEVVSQFNGLQPSARRPHIRVEWNSWPDIVPAVGTDIDGSFAGKDVAARCQNQNDNRRYAAQ